MNACLAPITGIDPPFKALVGATATGAGSAFLFSRPRTVVSMQVSYVTASAVKVVAEGSFDDVNWFTIATFDTGAGGTNGAIVTSNGPICTKVRANVQTLDGGGSVSASIMGS